MRVENNIPEGWVETSIGNVTVVESGGTPSTKNSLYWSDEIPWITPRDLSSFKGVFIEKGERSISIEGLDNSSAKLLPKNTILFSSRAPIGYVVIAKNETATNQGFKNLICDEVNSHFKYFYYLMKHKADLIERLSSGSTFSEASGSLIKSIEINLPPLPEQKAIAKVLTAFDDKIELLQAQNKTLETMAQTIFKEWFGKYQIGDELPEGWREYELGDVCNLSAGGDKPKNSTSKSEGENIIPIYSNGIKNEGLYGFTNNASIFDESVTVSARGTIGYVCLRPIPYVPIVRLVSVIPDKNYLSAKFLFYFLKNNQILGTGTTQQQLTIPDFKLTRIIIPNSKLMDDFTKLINTFYIKIYSCKNQIQSLTKTRDTLLTKLMSGQVRVNNLKQTADA